MPVAWGFRGLVLTLSVIGVVTNEEIEQAFDEAVANAPSRSDLRLLWDARATLTPVSSDDMTWRFKLVSALAARGILSRAALLVRSDQLTLLELARAQLQKTLPAIESEVFTDLPEALAWLEK
jgi:stage II sporulation SpoAA-like protein